jgi:hypothetical protein
MTLEEELELVKSKLEKYEKSPYAITYMTIYSQIMDMNKQLTITDEIVSDTVLNKDGLVVNLERQQGKVDLFAPSNEKAFDRAWKVMSDVDELLETLDKLRSKMTVEEQEENFTTVAEFMKRNRK